MTDAELTHAVLEKVIGIREGTQPNEFRVLRDGGIYWAGEDFDPLNDDRDVCAVLDKMVETKDCFLQKCGPEWNCYFTDSKEASGTAGPNVKGQAFDPDRRRAIVLAALRAKGVEVV